VTSIPDDQRGERLAVLYTKEDVTPAGLAKCLAETNLPKLWIPKKENLYLVESIPALGTGKLDLRGVKAKALELSRIPVTV